MKRCVSGGMLALCAALTGCLGDDGAGSGASAIGSGGGPSTTGPVTGAPTLTVTAAVDAASPPACITSGSALVKISGEITTTGSVAPTTITAAVDGGTATLIGSVTSADFTDRDRRTKVATWSADLTLTNGTHTIVVCVEQPGSMGNPRKTACATVFTVTVACEGYCGTTEAFGDIVHNPSLCTGNGPPHVPVHVRGDFGDDATLVITGTSYTRTTPIRHAGESCNYQYNWDTTGAPAGSYHFVVTGNSHQYSFDAELHCP